MVEGFHITEADIRRAQSMWDKERIEPLTRPEMFKGGLYAMLSASDNYPKQMKAFRALLEHKLDTPEGILDSPKQVAADTAVLRWNNNKPTHVQGYAEWWQGSDLPERIISDLEGVAISGVEFREEIVKQGGNGLGWKCASLFLRMCGYHYLVPIDRHVARFLIENGVAARTATKRSDRSYGREEYLAMEAAFSKIASQYNFTPGYFQLIVWTMRAFGHKGQMDLI